MDDGNALSRKAKRYYVFNTQCFPFDDQAPKPTRSPIIQALSHNFGIHAKIQKLSMYYIFDQNLRTVVLI